MITLAAVTLPLGACITDYDNTQVAMTSGRLVPAHAPRGSARLRISMTIVAPARPKTPRTP